MNASTWDAAEISRVAMPFSKSTWTEWTPESFWRASKTRELQPSHTIPSICDWKIKKKWRLDQFWAVTARSDWARQLEGVCGMTWDISCLQLQFYNVSAGCTARGRTAEHGSGSRGNGAAKWHPSLFRWQRAESCCAALARNIFHLCNCTWKTSCDAIPNTEEPACKTRHGNVLRRVWGTFRTENVLGITQTTLRLLANCRGSAGACILERSCPGERPSCFLFFLVVEFNAELRLRPGNDPLSTLWSYKNWRLENAVDSLRIFVIVQFCITCW